MRRRRRPARSMLAGVGFQSSVSQTRLPSQLNQIWIDAARALTPGHFPPICSTLLCLCVFRRQGHTDNERFLTTPGAVFCYRPCGGTSQQYRQMLLMAKIGRASCRERRKVWKGDGGVEEKMNNGEQRAETVTSTTWY